MNRIANWINFIFKFTVVGLALAFIVLHVWPGRIPVLEQPQSPEPNTRASLSATGYADAVNLAAPSVVSIYTRTVIAQRLNPLLQRLLGRREVSRTQQGLGSGVIVSSDGYILTNHHVIRNTSDIKVALWDGRISDAAIIGQDPDTDLAVLKIDQQGLPIAPLGDASGLQAGDIVLAIGNAVGLSHTVTMGIVSATGRNHINGALFQDFIQTDAAINAGNSGGALINVSGQVVGINTSTLGQALGAEGISFAIPIDLARSVMEQIIEYGKVRRGWIGAEFSNLSPGTITPAAGGDTDGILVERVYRNGPAWDAGLQPGDIIIRAGGEVVLNWRSFLFQVAQTLPGTELELEVVRNAQPFTTRVVLVQQPPPL